MSISQALVSARTTGTWWDNKHYCQDDKAGDHSGQRARNVKQRVMCKVTVKNHVKGFRFYPEINGKVQKGFKQRTIGSNSYLGKAIIAAV